VNIRDRIKELRRVPASQLKPNPKNWRTHPQAQQDALRGVLAEVGIADAVLARELPDGSLMLVDGHLRAETITDSEIPVLILDVNEAEADKILATLDPLAAMAEADATKLDDLLREVQTGNEALAGMLTELAEEAGCLSTQKPEIVEDEVPDPPVVPITKPGDLWILGDHRLLCGDSTKAVDVERLMAGTKAGMIHTDPPYGMSYQSNMRTKSSKFAVLENDDRVLTEWIEPAIRNSEGWVFIWTTWKVLEQWFPVVKPFGKLSNLVVWSKGGGGIGDLKKTFLTDHEIAFVFNRGAELCGKRIGSVWSFRKDAAGDYEHPTQKPVALAAEAIDKTTVKACTVYDPFLGSGTTLIASEQLKRKCYGIELSPQYCDVIVKRWENLTGKTAKLAKE
jgi:DNA modification methylase